MKNLSQTDSQAISSYRHVTMTMLSSRDRAPPTFLQRDVTHQFQMNQAQTLNGPHQPRPVQKNETCPIRSTTLITNNRATSELLENTSSKRSEIDSLDPSQISLPGVNLKSQ